jgi:SNF2 family DNA or RNA helicase
MDLFGQVFCLDGGQRLGQFITHYRYKYFHQVPWDQWTWYPNQTTGKEITRLLTNLAHTVDEKKWLNIKEPKVVERRVDLPPEAMKQYKVLEDQFITMIKDKVVTAANAAVLSGKLRQVASGSVYDENRDVVEVHDAKLEALESLVEELSKDPVIVVVGFLHEVDAIRKRLGYEVPYIGGGISDGQMARTIKHWNLGWIPVVLAHPTSVSAGLNLQAGGRSLCWYSMTWNREERDQMLRRIRRKGQTRQVFEYHIMANRTIDDYLIKLSVEKGVTQEQFLTGLEAFFGVKPMRAPRQTAVV